MFNKQALYENFEFEPDEQSCLFLNSFRLTRAICPFWVSCITSIEGMNKGEKVKVDKVLLGNESTILYQIQEKLYPHYYFRFKPPCNLVITNLK